MKSLLSRILGILCLIGTAQFSLAQAPDTLFTRTFGGSDNDFGNAVQQTSDGGFIIAGQFGRAGGFTSGDLWLIRTNAAGDTLWTKIYGGPGIDQGNSVQQTSDDGYVVAGYTTSIDGADRDAWLIRTDADGDTLWTRTLGGSSTDQANGVQQTSDGGFIVAGTTRSFGAGATDVWLIRTDANGDTLWTKTYGVSSSEAGNSVQLTSDGGFVITGSLFSIATGASDLWLLRTDAAGDTLWTKAFNGPYYPYSLDAGSAVQQTSDGGFIVVGETNGLPDTRNTDAWLIRTDAAGDTVWTRTFGLSGPSTDRGHDVQQTSDGGFVLVGFSFDGGSDIDALIVRTDAAGDSLWSITIGDAGNDQFTAVRETSDGGLIITGFTSSYGAGGNDAWLIRLDAETPTSVENIAHSAPDDFRLRQNYPNPFNPSTTISYALAESQQVELMVYNALGQAVRALVRQPQAAGEYTLTDRKSVV